MIETWKRTELDRLKKAYGLEPSKSLGQNFLTDGNIANRIADASGAGPEDDVVEIGPGLGALTVPLAGRAGRVMAVEIDKKLLPALGAAVAGAGNVEIVNEDFLKLPAETFPERFILVGNLPYYITTPIVARAIELSPVRCVFMMQREVAERLLSDPGKKTYGAITILVQHHCEAELVMNVSREVFAPRPGVDSSVVCLTPKRGRSVQPETEALMFRLVRAGFDMRRKTLRNSLARAGYPEATLLAALAEAGIDPIRRAETLSPKDFYLLAQCLSNKVQ
ncbi:MAG: 16S rRNA (adenine(1518)-N(6)/adenine(1519)-N(6))-dimethyltransferase RsmA [Clostridiales Family XIII bacterium]|jgi:16S rRNA (adenine1518-N6/adenine1519-N6)-dimethyltransferase|nr:16S rRNA (adenine(1518)-N(6)/adenine(1519)-N(6))-dimethyltransferase RsmA [Clostridiales Family XIII bacterium]